LQTESIQVIWAAGLTGWFSMEIAEQGLKSKDQSKSSGREVDSGAYKLNGVERRDTKTKGKEAQTGG
jgi:hypothetical protein